VTTHGTSQIERRFEKALEAFSMEAETPTQYLYAHLTMHAVTAEDAGVVARMDTNPLYWNTVAGALQLSTFVSLHRLFDPDSSCNADSILKMAEENVGMFSRQALAIRVQRCYNLADAYDWVQAAFEPTEDDFRRLRGEVRSRRNVYDEVYRPIRGRVFAHRIASQDNADRLFAATHIDELQDICTFFPALHEALFDLYFNGQRAVVQTRTISIRDIRAGVKTRGVHKDIVLEAERALRQLGASAAK
jgi:hypothetical protein